MTNDTRHCHMWLIGPWNINVSASEMLPKLQPIPLGIMVLAMMVCLQAEMSFFHFWTHNAFVGRSVVLKKKLLADLLPLICVPFVNAELIIEQKPFWNVISKTVSIWAYL